MTKHFCDRCGKAIDIDKDKCQVVQSSFVAAPVLNVLLCELCYGSVVDFVTSAARKAKRVSASASR